MAIDKYGNGQVKQGSDTLSPADGADGYIGSDTGTAFGMKIVTGKKGSVTSQPIWNDQSSFTETQDNTGSTGNNLKGGGQDSTDEKASYKKVETDEGLPQTFYTHVGNSGVPPANAENGNSTEADRMAQSVPDATAGDHEMDLPQTEYTHAFPGGAPFFKHAK